MAKQGAVQRIDTFLAGILFSEIFKNKIFYDELEYNRNILSLFCVYGGYSF
jgi:hypothetical protein